MVVTCVKFHKQFRQWYLLERGSTDNLQDFIHRGCEIFLLLGDGDEEVGAECGPDLNPHAVRRVAEKSAEAQVLLDPAEEKFDGPAASINRGDDERGQVELVSQKDQRLLGFRIDMTDAAQRFRVSRTAFFGAETDRLIAAQTHGLVHRPRCNDVLCMTALIDGKQADSDLDK